MVVVDDFDDLLAFILAEHGRDKIAHKLFSLHVNDALHPSRLRQ